MSSEEQLISGRYRQFKVRLFVAFIALVIDSRRCDLLLQDDVQLWLSHIAFCKKWVSIVSCALLNDSAYQTVFSCDDTDASLDCLPSGHQRPDQQSVLLHARHPL